MSELLTGYVNKVTNVEGVTTITFFHPAQNSMPAALLQQLANAILEAGASAATRLIVLKSAGDRTFCAGASFDELLQIDNEEKGAAFFAGFANIINACRTCGKIIIGRVQGKAVGGGVGLAAATDYCLTTETASIKLSELAIGIGPFVIAPAVMRKVGLPAFSQLTLRATDFQSAQWAKEKGLYAEVYADITQLDAAVNELATKLASYNPEALTELKHVLWEGTEHWDSLLRERAAVSGRLVLSGFTQQALKAFLKRE